MDVPGEARRPGPALRHRAGRKTDARDTHSIAVVAVRTRALRVLRRDGELEALRMLSDRVRAARLRVQTVNLCPRSLNIADRGKRQRSAG